MAEETRQNKTPDTENRVAWESREISVPMAAGGILLAVALVLVLGISVGSRFFWNSYDRRTPTEAALARWQAAVAKDPTNAQSYYELGWAYYQTGDLAKACEAYSRALELEPEHVGARYNLALIARDQGQPERAVALLRWITEKYPRHELAQYSLGLAYMDLKRYDEAAGALQQALAVNPTSADTHCELGLCYRALGDEAQAVRELQEALRYNPNLDAAKKALTER